MAAHQEPVNPGELSTPYVLGRAYEAPPVLTVARQYVRLGILHIVPRGLDHILFVLGLFLLSAKFRPLAWQITAFTVAHTLTLALAAADIVALPAKPVEILIAASIAFVAIENLLTEELHWWRPVTVFLFGLLHGLGFAGVLGEIGLPQDRFLTGLLSFNIGVEIAQLAIVALAFVIVARFREAAAYRKVVVVPGSLLIASVGIYMAVERAIS